MKIGNLRIASKINLNDDIGVRDVQRGVADLAESDARHLRGGLEGREDLPPVLLPGAPEQVRDLPDLLQCLAIQNQRGHIVTEDDDLVPSLTLQRPIICRVG